MTVSKEQLQKVFELFCKAAGKKAATSPKDVGAWHLGHGPGGYVVEEITNGKPKHPITTEHFSAATMSSLLNFAGRAFAAKRR